MSDTTDDMECKAWLFISTEELWEFWFHITREWKEILLEDMTESHLLNTIKFFNVKHPSPLYDELYSRKI